MLILIANSSCYKATIAAAGGDEATMAKSFVITAPVWWQMDLWPCL
jgi:hypothetical protein